MSVIECDVPASSALDRELVGHCDFRDSYRVPLSHPERGMADIFFAVFGHTPRWMKAMLILSINLLGDWLRDALNPKLR